MRMLNRRTPLWVKVLLGLFTLVFVLVLGVSFWLPAQIIGGMKLDQPVPFDSVENPADYGLQAEELTLQTADGLKLSAYMVPVAQPRAAVVYLSGIQGPSVTVFFGHARWMKTQGIASLLLDMRAHGRSEGQRIMLGTQEWQDVQAAVQSLRQQYPGTPVVLHGLSMGGAVAIIAASRLPEVAGVIAMSPYSDFGDLFLDQMAKEAPPAFVNWERPFVRAYLRLHYGASIKTLTPVRTVAGLGNRPLLLMHSRGDTQTPFASFERLKAAAPPHTEFWVLNGDRHTILLDEQAFKRPESDPEYARRVLALLNSVARP